MNKIGILLLITILLTACASILDPAWLRDLRAANEADKAAAAAEDNADVADGTGDAGTAARTAEQNALAQLFARSTTVAELSSAIFADGIYAGTSSAAWGAVTVKVDIMQTANLKQAYIDYCGARGGEMVSRYVPDGYEPALGRAFQSQPIFFHDSTLGRTEFEFCVSRDPAAFSAPIFTITPTDRSSFYLLEGESLVKYVETQKKMVQTFADEAKITLALYSSLAPSVNNGLTFTRVNLVLYTARPTLMLEIGNESLLETVIPLESPVSIQAKGNTYTLMPAYAGGERYDITLQQGDCVLSRDNSALKVPVDAVCNLAIGLTSEDDIWALLAGDFVTSTNRRGDTIGLNYIEHDVTMRPRSQFDTANSGVWLKPRLDSMQRVRN